LRGFTAEEPGAVSVVDGTVDVAAGEVAVVVVAGAVVDGAAVVAVGLG
jgi:hypothetical protein